MPISKTLLRRADPVRSRELPALTPEQDALAGRFSQPVRRDIRRLMRLSNRLTDLAVVFPGALYALAIGHGTPLARQQVFELIEQGAPLKVVARTLGLPLWLRRMPPEAFTGEIGLIPSSEAFTRRIATRMPATPAESAFWLASISFAAKAGHDEFAVWLAEQPIFSEGGDPERLFSVLAAYAWFSGDVFSRAHGLIVVPWRSEIAFDTALCAAKSWLNRVRLILQLTPGVIGDTWVQGGASGAYTFTPLTEAREILDEAHGMQNCADQYADRLARDRCRLFSVKRGTVRVATLEVGPHPRETGVLTITQLKSRHNMPASLEIWQAAYAWMSAQTGLKRLPTMTAPERALDLSAWRQLIAPYRYRKGGAPWLPDVVTPASFAVLDADMADLARRGGVSSWLFT